MYILTKHEIIDYLSHSLSSWMFTKSVKMISLPHNNRLNSLTSPYRSLSIYLIWAKSTLIMYRVITHMIQNEVGNWKERKEKAAAFFLTSFSHSAAVVLLWRFARWFASIQHIQYLLLLRCCTSVCRWCALAMLLYYPTSVRDNRDFVLTLLLGVVVAFVLSALVASYKITRYPERYNYCFHSQQSRQHAVAGCLMTAIFLFPAFIRGSDSVLPVFFVMAYTFIFVPLASGLCQIPFQDTWKTLSKKLR